MKEESINIAIMRLTKVKNLIIFVYFILLFVVVVTSEELQLY